MINLSVCINDKKETELLEIKEQYYSTDKKFDLIKDVAAFANNLNNKE